MLSLLIGVSGHRHHQRQVDAAMAQSMPNPASQSPGSLAFQPSPLSSQGASLDPASLDTASIQYSTRELDQATAHIVTIPARYNVAVAIVPGLDPVAAIAQQAGAAVAINAGFFDPQNDQTTSHVVIDGEVAADPRDNERLMDNPDLAPYLDQILNRSEFRRYRCGSEGATQYAIVAHDASVPNDCQLVDAVGGGPQLLPNLTATEEGFVATEDGIRIRDAIGADQPNARSAVGLTAAGEILFVAVAQRPDVSGSGLSLIELANLMRSLGAETALNLDGGSSTTLYYRGQTYLGRWVEGEPVERSVKTVLMVAP